MRREIKFRAKVSEEMKELYQLITYPDTDFVYGDLHLKRNHPHIHVDSHSKYWIDIDTIGQFTGLYDKNGKEIYEGDILMYCGEMKIIVVFNHGAFGYYSRSDDFITFSQNVNFSFWKNDEDDKFEIIGNIYDNPELIKESEEK